MSRDKLRLSKALLRPVNTTAIVLLGFYTVLWGVWLASPFWNAFSRAPLYSEMSSLFSEWIWGGIAIVCGLATVWGAYRPSYRALINGASIAFIHWLVIAIFYFWGDWRNTGGITALTFSTYAAFIYINIRVNHRNGHMKIEDILS